MICKICNNSKKNKAFNVKEMMFGIKDEFTYFECSKCGCLQIAEIPTNMERYYPSNYYSFNDLQQNKESSNMLKKYMKRKRDEYALFRKGIMGQLIYTKYPNSLFYVIGQAKIDYNSKILDVGCGNGGLLYSLNELSFKNLTGVDLYIKSEIVGSDIKIHKKTICDLPDKQKYDLIMFNHSFEHIYDQLQTLIKVSNLLSENGTCLIRTPIKTDYIWNKYGINWVQIDAPRHFFLHTIKSFELLVKKTYFSIQDIVFDSFNFQFWGSEQYKRNIPLLAKESYLKNPQKSIFSKKTIKEFKKRALDLNLRKQGDQAAFFITKNS